DIIDGYRESYGGNGAGIEYCRQTDLALENCNFDHCVGPLSGAIHASDYSHLHFNGVRVTNCEADEGTGGGISAYQCAVVSLKDVEIEGCESWNVGGGIEICTIGLPTEWLDIELDDVRITNCDVQREGAVGAGLSISYVYEDTTVLKNVVLADNLGAFGETHDLGLYRAYITANEACGLGHVDCFAEASVTINQAPTAETDSATATENEPIAIPVLENDHDLEGDVISLVSATNPLHGQVEINTETGMVTYTPDSGYTGSDHFSYTISDDLDNFATGSVTVMVEEGQKFIYLPLVTNQFR
ncbi:MAG: Ig-like domain-containing protein, partial [Patescibacteria group bacterium]|nr:Ig-like domain-containing protein [Patescibacteria group bacterium]